MEPRCRRLRGSGVELTGSNGLRPAYAHGTMLPPLRGLLETPGWRPGIIFLKTCPPCSVVVLGRAANGSPGLLLHNL